MTPPTLIRLNSLDCVKGLAIFLMVYAHIEHAGTFAVAQKGIVGGIYTFHMPLFLIVSGFLFKIQRESLPQIGKIFSRLTRPYLIFISLYLLGLMVVDRLGIPTSNHPPISCADFASIVAFHPRGGYWFLHSLILIQSALILPFFIKNLTKAHSLISIGCTLAIFGLLIKYNIISPRTIFYFFVGMMIKLFSNEIRGSILVGACLGVLTIALFGSELFEFGFPQVAWVVGIFIFIMGIVQSKYGLLFVPVLSWLGRNSLSILVFHALFVVLFKLVAKSILKIDPTGISNSIVTTLSVVAGCLLFAAIIDKFSLTKIFFGVPQIYFPFKGEVAKPSA